MENSGKIEDSAPYQLVKRVKKPPGGDCSDIFNVTPSSTPPSTPRKKNHMASNIFGPTESSGSSPRVRKPDDSFNKLFGTMAVEENAPPPPQVAPTVQTPTPRIIKDHQKSNIFFIAENNGEMNGHSTKGVIGDAHDSASSSGNSSGSVSPTHSPTPNGSLNGDTEVATNGHGPIAGEQANGVATNGELGTPKAKRIPPGGHSTKLW